jgi:hypothetical protein
MRWRARDSLSASAASLVVSRLEILLVCRARFAEMDLAVDDARQDVKAGAVDRLASGSAGEIAERGDAPAADAHIAPGDAVMIGDDAASEDEVECLRHGRGLAP